MWMILFNSSMRMLNSIATGFPVLDVGEFVGLDELENWALDHLFV